MYKASLDSIREERNRFKRKVCGDTVLREKVPLTLNFNCEQENVQTLWL